MWGMWQKHYTKIEANPAAFVRKINLSMPKENNYDFIQKSLEAQINATVKFENVITYFYVQHAYYR